MIVKETELAKADRPAPAEKLVQPEQLPPAVGPVQPEGEQGGPKGPEPTRFGDWEKNGRCFDF
ncbi:MAG TPA: DUF1674 domain-containing protein [Geminicoccus sp.]|jgi:hypothetical protein|uniref:succinate dehydrogenase assembly factor 4 n=1 Tax=Geminicoccus sp. TaxID=2024832 RepID=UPI002E34E49B|nr:succinate dehydrogenase assembly factor 4 [Geminicoccus sp.]HEX2529804.1 DUF1674 domain-containing protein [Geminicoccus sp.]